MPTKSTKFRGIPSGDGDSLCFDVIREDFIRLMGRPPGRFDKSIRYHGLYRYYPDDLLPEVGGGSEALLDFEVAVGAEPTLVFAKPFKAYRVAAEVTKED
jgi:hypothetical protein